VNSSSSIKEQIEKEQSIPLYVASMPPTSSISSTIASLHASFNLLEAAQPQLQTF
jgi:hypothetical protein